MTVQAIAPVPPSALVYVPVDPAAIVPAFEGKVVSSASVKVNGITDIGINNAALQVDDIVRLYVEARVTGVSHIVDKDGELVRSHVLKPIHAELAQFDPSDPNDSGILRP
jgi:hypothetical protein